MAVVTSVVEELRAMFKEAQLAAWQKLTEEERNMIALTHAGYKGSTETFRILSRLVERLQQQVVELESLTQQPTP